MINQEEKYELLDPKVDFIFKQIFGSVGNEEILISFLNSILKLEGNNEIKKVKLLDTHVNKDLLDDKSSILDIRADIEEGIQINIEVQLINEYNIEKRTLYYWSKMYGSQLKKGNKYNKLKKTITINILNFDYLEEINKYHSIFHLREDETGKILTDDIEIHILELLKLPQIVTKDRLIKWLKFLTKIDRKEMEEIAMGEPTIKKAIEKLEYLSQDKEMRAIYERRLKEQLDRNSWLDGAMMKGMEKGIEKGKIEIARNMLSLGIDILIIEKSTGLTEEEIKKLI